MSRYPDTDLYIDGAWGPAASGERLEVVNPATGEVIGSIARAGKPDLERALDAAARGFRVWRATNAFERAKLLRRAADILRARTEALAVVMTTEQGKPLSEARLELGVAADTIDWFSGEAQRIYGRVIEPRNAETIQMVVREPVGPVAAFGPWNFPVNQIVRKLAAALAAGCSIIVKAAEETPASPAGLVQAFVDAGLPPGVLNLVYGDPAEISTTLIESPIIRKVTFTGSTAVGKQLAALAGRHMKKVTMELGGHAPVLVDRDADIARAVKISAAGKFRNAGQVCVAPTRFIVHDEVYERFVNDFAAVARGLKVGPGLDEGVQMGPLANPRRVTALEDFIADALAEGAELVTGGKKIGNAGNFFEPTVLGRVPVAAKAMHEEPFGPLALVSSYGHFDDMIAEANRLDYGLAAYAFTGSDAHARRLGNEIEAGMVSINGGALSLPETPFGGIGDSGHGSEGGAEAIESYLTVKFITRKS